MKRKILVTSGADYIGSHACKALAQAGYEPIVYDNLSTGHTDAVRWGPLEIGDILDFDLARNCLAWEPVVPLKEGLMKTIEYFDRLLSVATLPQLFPLHQVGETETSREATVGLGAVR